MADVPAPARPLPKPFDPERAARVLASLAEGDPPFAPDASQRPLLVSAFANSPYLGRLAMREKETLASLLSDSSDVLARIEADALGAGAAADMDSAMRILRRAKRQAALAIGLADIGGSWTVDDVTAALTRFADACVHGALRFLLKQAAGVAGLGASPEALEDRTGLVVLAMGKFGAFELNYSSDIDLVIFYDAEIFPFRKKGEARLAAVDLVKGLVKLLSEVTADGYVFRTDLRLRPDAGATQVAISTEAAEHYYEAMGQNWERAAMIKARACAGDSQAAARFLKAIQPFIWRKHLDYAAIEDIHSIKRQIHAHAGHGAIAVAGHNIKLGRGGIREIEFFVQTQQLIAGGRNAALRPPATLAALDALRVRGLISGETSAELAAAYRFLRHVEHRLQMIDDQQTHTLPSSRDELRHVALFAGFDDLDSFSAQLRRHLETVQRHYAHLFERSLPLSGGQGSLVFTGVEDDPETLATLAGMGYRDAPHVSGAIRAWHHGRIRATRSARAREILTALIPWLLEALAATADPDAAFAQFDRFFSRLSSGVQVLSLLQARPELLKLIARICGSAPRLADHLARAPAILDALLDPGYLTELPASEALRDQFSGVVAGLSPYEAKLDAARRFAREQIFRVGVQVIEGAVSAEIAGAAFSNIAETVISGLLPVVEQEFEHSHGRIVNGQFAVVAMGRLGAREMTAGSDLDLVFVYDAPEASAPSDGKKSLPASLYYVRLAQRLISALTIPTVEGALYEVDMRLRPSGNKGPVAVSLQTFARYHAVEAWTWERMALTRARVILAPDVLGRKVEAAIEAALRQTADPAVVIRDAREMRDRIASQFPAANGWDLKFAPGGLVDIEFIAQALQLCTAARLPGKVAASTVAALESLSLAGALDPADAQILISTARVEQSLLQVLRIAVEGTLQPQSATHGLKALLAKSAGAHDFVALEAALADAQIRVRAIFDRLLRAEAA